MPWPLSSYQPCPVGVRLAFFHRLFSSLSVPESSPRLMKDAFWSAILVSASVADFMPLMPTGSPAGPTMTKSLCMTSCRLTTDPLSTSACSELGACARTASASPRSAMASASPEPTAMTFTL